MKQFIAKRTEDGAELQQVPTEKIKVYENTYKAEQALDDLQVGEVIATKDNSYNTGLPLGSVISLDGDILPAGFLKCDGSRFDTNKYPLLAAYLGSNRLPEIYDNDQPSDWEEVYNQNYSGTSWTVANPGTLQYTAEYDGILHVRSEGASQVGVRLTVFVYNSEEDRTTRRLQGLIGATGYSCDASVEFSVQKGDRIGWSVRRDASPINVTIMARYNKKCKVIKATEGGYEKSDYVYSLLTDLVAKQNTPDWDSATAITFTNSSWTAEADGWIAGVLNVSGVGGTTPLSINGIPVGICAYAPGSYATEQGVFVRVSAGNVATIGATISPNLKFVPHK